MSDTKNIWDTVKTAKYLGIARKKLYEYMEEGLLKPFIDIDRHRLFRKEDVIEFKKSIKK